jgi:hypothetical protein
VKAAGMKIRTDHSPRRLASDTGTNLPLWKAVVEKVGTVLLMRDMVFPWLELEEMENDAFLKGDGVTIAECYRVGELIASMRLIVFVAPQHNILNQM